MQRKNLEKTLDFFKYYNNQKGLPKLIIRPHPAEDNETYIKEIKKLKNVILVDDQTSIIPWILACNSFIAYNCTAQIECSLLGKRPINLEFEKHKDLKFDITRLVSKNIDNKDNIIDYLKNEKKNIDYYEKSKLINDLSKRINNVEDEKCAVHNICEQIEKIEIKNLKGDVKVSFIHFIFLKFVNYCKNYMIFAKALTSKKNWEIYQMSKKKNLGISLKEVETNIQRLNSIYKFGDFKIKEILPSVFCIEKK